MQTCFLEHIRSRKIGRREIFPVTRCVGRNFTEQHERYRLASGREALVRRVRMDLQQHKFSCAHKGLAYIRLERVNQPGRGKAADQSPPPPPSPVQGLPLLRPLYFICCHCSAVYLFGFPELLHPFSTAA